MFLHKILLSACFFSNNIIFIMFNRSEEIWKKSLWFSLKILPHDVHMLVAVTCSFEWNVTEAFSTSTQQEQGKSPFYVLTHLERKLLKRPCYRPVLKCSSYLCASLDENKIAIWSRNLRSRKMVVDKLGKSGD